MEQALLGSVLVSGGIAPGIRALVAPSDFAVAAHSAVFGAMIALADAGKPVDIQLLGDRLERDKVLEKLGGFAFLSRLEDAVPTSANIEHYAQLVRDASLKRRLAQLLLEGQAFASNGVSAVDALTKIRAGLDHLVDLALTAAGSTVISLDSIQPEAVEWYWPGWYPAGKLVIKDGDPGLGKSIHSCYMAGCFTNRRPFPDGWVLEEPAGVVILNAEDGLADTLVPRLLAAGADMKQVVTLQLPGRTFGIPEDIPVLEQAIRKVGAKYVSIDPLAAYLGSKVDAFKDHDVRRALAPLAELASRTGAVIELTRHLNKRQDLSAMYRGGGSIGIIGAARVGILIAPDPEQPGTQVVACIKSNLGPRPTSLRYCIREAPSGAAELIWLGESTATADSLIAATDPVTGRGVEILRQILAAGPVAARVALVACEAAELTGGSLDRAKKKLRVRSEKQPGAFSGTWYWMLPEHLAGFLDGGGVVQNGALRGPSSEEHHHEEHRRTPKNTEDSNTKVHAPARESDPDEETFLALVAAGPPDDDSEEELT
jgi:hypothetical protein